MSASSSQSPGSAARKRSCPDKGRSDGSICSAGPGSPDQGLAKKQRLSDSSAFKEAFERGRPFVGRYLVLRRRKGPDAGLRLGVIVSKRTLPRSVDRSRAKRLMREAFRLNRARFKADCDVVLIGRKPLAQAKMADVEHELLRLAGKCGLLP